MSNSSDEKNDNSYKTTMNADAVEQKAVYLNFEKFDIVYEINGEIFRQKSFEDDDYFCEFNVNIAEGTSLEEQEAGEIFLDVSIQEVKNGILVDSRIFLSRNQWNTLVTVDDISFCVVCDQVVPSNILHASEEGHIENLQKYKPLKKFDYSITRMIKENYHCAVCNVTFEINSDKIHFDGENHQYSMFNALNQDIHVNVDETEETINNETCVDDNGTCVDDNETNNNDDSDYDYEIFFDDKITKLPYNSLNMIVILWIDKFYCMACKMSDHISMKENHCSRSHHARNLVKCHVVDKYKSVVIRQVDEQYYHCGYCNCLVLISEIEDHLYHVHEDNTIQNSTNKHKNLVPTNNTETTTHQTNIDSIDGIGNIKENNGPYEISSKLVNNVSPRSSDITVYESGCNLRISSMAYNTLIRDADIFYCALCDLSIDEEATLLHTTDSNHLRFLKAVQFDQHFGYNLIRVLHERAHCSICNMQFHISSASHHITTQMHLRLLNQAKFVTIPEKKCTITKNKNLEQIELNPTKQPSKTDAEEDKVESNQNVESLQDMNEALESYNHDFIYLNFKNTFYKISFNSYNSLIVVGDGARYCFVCSVKVNNCTREHVQSAAHTRCMKKCKFIDKYNKHILRQVFITYHCCICNVIFTKKNLDLHLSWPLENIKTNKMIRKNDIKSGIKVIYARTQNDQIYPEMQEPEIIIRHIKIKPKSNSCIKKESKVIIVCSKIFKINWDSWQGLTLNGNLVFCNLCNKNLKEYELNSHIHEECHAGALENTFDKQYYPHLIRNINDKTANCVICHLFICNKKHIILEHLNGKKHLVNYKNIVGNDDTNYCNDSVLYL